mmetsp:Transcript_3708/g.8355  ORF Transcript_3708/g.8355 Transcript_3708/m.8355 type:complete len:187 (-) Transcript_3708:137-697(-)|eukprot:CAMPEP_0178624894 /NCGR_PEP_ID=MMETSP0698-20121128/7591_1 /TAXON_ID=265572 /ORGANISM="Extubocellulus spinifer, Strain CCMP396" /LENGTH=186 /DNA_ID=CAMNT_0020264027 /DNA_START=77 /DNA_END=637 /DNA_ORIENTATION=+
MKTTFSFAVFTVLATIKSFGVNAELRFRPVAVDGEEHAGERRLGRCGWGQFEEDTLAEYCMTNVRGKAVLQKCINEGTPSRQLWRFEDKLEYDEDELPYDCGGILKNRADKKCLAPIRGGIKRGRRLALDKCDKGDGKQQWLGDGDTLVPESKERLCVWYRGDLEEGAPMVLKKCENLDSLNFGRK